MCFKHITHQAAVGHITSRDLGYKVNINLSYIGTKAGIGKSFERRAKSLSLDSIYAICGFV
jgi:hypothetical protein